MEEQRKEIRQEVRQNIIEFSEESGLQEVEIAVQEKEWEIYDNNRIMAK